MSHLPSERLAALVDEAPSAPELLHLASCAECARERAAYENVVALSGAEAARIGAPLTAWEQLAPVLVADGVIDDGRGLRLRSRQVRRPWLQAAAAVLFIAGGMMAGRVTAGASVLPVGDGERVAASLAPVSSDSVPTFESVDDAMRAQERSQAIYQTATAFIAQRDTTTHRSESPSAIRTRLAAIEQTNTVMGEALKAAPYDAVINGYCLSTLGQREATLRQLNAVMPASMRITSY